MTVLKNFRSFIFVSLLIAGNSYAASPILKGGEITVTDVDIELYVHNLLKSEDGKVPAVDAGVIRQIADLIYVTRVLAEESKKISEVDNSKVKWLGNFQMDSVLKEALLNVEANESLRKINFEATAKDLYEKQKNQFLTEEQVHVAHILLSTRGKNESEVKKKILKIRDEAKSSEDFLALAKRYSEDPSAKRNSGDLGYFGRGKMVKPFELTAFELKKGEISEPVKTPFGYHILKLIDKKGGLPRDFKEVKPAIISELKKQLASKNKVDRLDQIAEAATIKPDQEAVDKLVKKYNKVKAKKD